MKKLLALTLVICLLPTYAFADMMKTRFHTQILNKIPDLSLSQLQTLNEAVQSRLFEVSLSSGGVLIPPGEGYVVGVDIPAGVYRIVFEKGTFGFCIIAVDTHTELFNHVYSLNSENPEINRMELKNGTTVDITDGSIRLFPYTGIFH